MFLNAFSTRPYTGLPYSLPSPVPLSQQRLDSAAELVHRLLSHFGYQHTFLGGYAIKALSGKKREVSSIDVEVEKPLFGGWQKLKNIFLTAGVFYVSDRRYIIERAVNSDRVVMRLVDVKMGVYIYILERSKNSPKEHIQLDNKPFYSVTDLLIEKIRCCAERRDPTDPCDITYLYNFHKHTVNLEKIRRKISPEMAVFAARKYPHDAPFTVVMKELGILPRSFDRPQSYVSEKVKIFTIGCCF